MFVANLRQRFQHAPSSPNLFNNNVASGNIITRFATSPSLEENIWFGLPVPKEQANEKEGLL
jgi:hypothetical protein